MPTQQMEPTPLPGRPESEFEEYEYKKVVWKDFLKPKYIPWWILGIVISVLVILLFARHSQIVDALRPTSEKIRDLPAGFVIPVVILILISFPPLFGHELIALLCGVVWGLWIGFAIVAVGTFLGEIGTWFAFKYAFRRKAVKLERTNLNYGSLARVTRDGGFWIVLVIRFSVIPSHFSTAVFSTCNVKFWYFAVATFMTLPKQIILVYIGVLVAQQSKSNTINDIVLGITFVITLIAGAYIYAKMSKAKKTLLAEQTARLNAKQNLSTVPSFGSHVQTAPPHSQPQSHWRPERDQSAERDVSDERQPTLGEWQRQYGAPRQQRDVYEMRPTYELKPMNPHEMV